jgi:uncharacterized protein
LLGGILALYALVGLAAVQWTISRQRERWLSPLVALCTGLINGATGVSAIPLVPYLASLGLDKEQLIQAMGLSFTTLMLALAVGLALSGNLRLDAAGQSVLALLPVMIGMLLGQGIRRRLAAETFKRWFYVGLLALGLHMSWRGVAAMQAAGTS